MDHDLESAQDVMQVCRNGHVVTDRLRGDPGSARFHCDQCGAATLHECPTCGVELPGARSAADLVPIGIWPAPRYCQTCGAAFPWLPKPRPTPEPLATLETLLRRLPLMIRQFRWRQGEQPPFRVENERDLEDLLRAVLQLRFDDVRLEGRTPAYSAVNRSDLLLAAEKIAVAVKWAGPNFSEAELRRQCEEDVAYYSKRGGCRTLMCYVFDPEGRVRERERVETAGAGLAEGLDVRCVVSGP
jgi:hypothetical protein